jgi:hypothetical protein
MISDQILIVTLVHLINRGIPRNKISDAISHTLPADGTF